MWPQCPVTWDGDLSPPNAQDLLTKVNDSSILLQEWYAIIMDNGLYIRDIKIYLG